MSQFDLICFLSSIMNKKKMGLWHLHIIAFYFYLDFTQRF